MTLLAKKIGRLQDKGRTAGEPVANPKPPAAGGGKAKGGLIYRRLDKVEAKPVNWLWPGRIALVKVTLIAGDPGLGKSQITAFLAGVVTTGGQWPVDRAKSPQGGVIFLSAEDDAADTIRPRLEAANADLSRCLVVDSIVDKDETGRVRERTFSLKKDLDLLATIIREAPDVRLIVIDPITAYMGGIDSHKASDVREFMAPLGRFAEKYQLAILGISHLNKSGIQEAVHRISGSLAIVAAARAAYLVVKDKSNPARRLLLPLKNNLAKDIGGFAFSIEEATIAGGLATSRVAWEAAPVHMTADEAMSARTKQDDNGQIDQAAQFLLDLLAAGPLTSGEVKTEAESAGFSWATIRRAKEKGGIKSERESPKGRWFWALNPDAQIPDAQTLHTTNEHLEQSQTNQGFKGCRTSPDAQVFCLEHLGKNTAKKALDLAAEI